MDKRGKFIVIDGMDGAGKGTQIKLLKKKLEGKNVLFTREPGGTPLAEEIREMLVRTDGPQRNIMSDLFLFFAARASHVEDVVEPARKRGMHVISDRYDSSTFAFQICGENAPKYMASLFTSIRKRLPLIYYPDLYIFLDLAPEVAYKRLRAAASQKTSRFDVLPLMWHKRVSEGYRLFSERFGGAQFVDADQTPEEVHEEIWRIVSKMLRIR